MINYVVMKCENLCDEIEIKSFTDLFESALYCLENFKGNDVFIIARSDRLKDEAWGSSIQRDKLSEVFQKEGVEGLRQFLIEENNFLMEWKMSLLKKEIECKKVESTTRRKRKFSKCQSGV